MEHYGVSTSAKRESDQNKGIRDFWLTFYKTSLTADPSLNLASVLLALQSTQTCFRMRINYLDSTTTECTPTWIQRKILFRELALLADFWHSIRELICCFFSLFSQWLRPFRLHWYWHRMSILCRSWCNSQLCWRSTKWVYQPKVIQCLFLLIQTLTCSFSHQGPFIGYPIFVKHSFTIDEMKHCITDMIPWKPCSKWGDTVEWRDVSNESAGLFGKSSPLNWRSISFF